MAQQSPNVIDLYQGAVDEMLPTLSAVRADQLTAATPCTDWNVQNLITHNIKIADFVQGIILGNNTTNPFEVGDPLPAQGGREAFAAGTAKVLEQLKSGDIYRVMETPFGTMPLSSFIMFPTLDIVIHQWDLSKGIGANSAIDAGLAEACYGALQMGAEGGRAQGAFAAEVIVPISAMIQDKLLALSGRTP